MSDETVKITFGGVSYSRWTRVDIDSDIFTPADAFHVEAPLPDPQTQVEARAGSQANPYENFLEGAKVEVHVGDVRQMAGVIDDVEFTVNAREDRMTVSGRDLGAFLVDGEAPAIAGDNLTLATLIDKLVDDSFGIRDVIFSNEENRRLMRSKKEIVRTTAPALFSLPPRRSTKIDTGQSIAAILDEHTRRLGLAWWLTAKGELFIGKPNYKQDASYEFNLAAPGTRDAQRNNVLEATVTRSLADRYSVVQVNGAGLPDRGSTFDTNKRAPKFSKEARDPELQERGIVRRLILPDYDLLTEKEAQARADYEMGRRRMGALKINLTVPGFSQDGKLYTVDTTASVRVDAIGLKGVYYVTQRRFTEDKDARRTELTLCPKGVWLA